MIIAAMYFVFSVALGFTITFGVYRLLIVMGGYRGFFFALLRLTLAISLFALIGYAVQIHIPDAIKFPFLGGTP